MNRRTLLKLAAAGTATTVIAGRADAASSSGRIAVLSPGKSHRAYNPALNELASYAEKAIAAAGMPGMIFCLADGEGFAASGTVGWADMDRRIAVDHSHLFQIGSISKSFAALCVYRLADEGKIDLGAPLSRYLPDVPLPAEPILVQQVLSHTAGLPASAPIFPRVPDGRLWTGFTPGTSFFYSNTGYELIGLLIERVTGKPFPQALRDLVITPLGIGGLREVTQTSDRARYAIGYSPLDSSGPNITGVPLGHSQWTNFDTADGGIGATADAMTAYLQFLISVGQGKGSPLFSDASARRFSTVTESAAASTPLFGKGTGYASGLAIIDLDGHAVFHHTGGTRGFSSCVTVDPVAGVACFASVNGAIAGYRPADVTKYGCRLLRHAREGGTAPVPVEAAPANHIEHADEYAGTYIGPEGDRFQLLVRSRDLYLAADGREGRVQLMGDHKFMSDHPRFGSHFLDFERGGDAVTGVWFGRMLYGRGAALPQPAVPSELAALQGVYVSNDFFSGWWRSVFVQRGRLVMENITYRSKGTLRNRGDYWDLEGAENPCERIRFEALIDGVPQRLNASGRDLWRFNKI